MSANGCGPWWYPNKWKDRYFEDACNVHDKDYADGMERKLADRRFKDAMLKRSGKHPIRRTQARVFYWLVRLFGWHTHGN